MSEWISVKDRLPENGQQVIIFGQGSKGDYFSDALFESDSFLLFHPDNDEYCVDTSPTHWMPLPDAPK